MSGVRAIGFVFLLTVPSFAGEPKLKLTWIQAAPGDFALAGKWASQHIVVTGKLADGTLRDVTGQTRFKSSNSKVAAVTKTGTLDDATHAALVSAVGELAKELAAGLEPKAAAS